MYSKKGVAIGWETLLVIAVIVVLGVFYFGQQRAQAKDFNLFWSSKTLQLKLDDCKLKSDRDGIVSDIDGDLLDDRCDPCVCPHEGCRNTKEYDADGDLIPARCDKNDADPTITGCSYTPTNDRRCVEGAPLPSKV